MSTEPEETDAKRLEREHEVERVPEGTFGGTRKDSGRSREMNPNLMIQEIKDTARIRTNTQLAEITIP